ncbi:hypothetical protein DOY81_012334, partial [Sarcophaga bullata]
WAVIYAYTLEKTFMTLLNTSKIIMIMSNHTLCVAIRNLPEATVLLSTLVYMRIQIILAAQNVINLLPQVMDYEYTIYLIIQQRRSVLMLVNIVPKNLVDVIYSNYIDKNIFRK